MTLKFNFLKDLYGLVYPEICCACGRRLKIQENYICLHCSYTLPKTNFAKEADNLVAKKLAGRIPYQAAMAMYYFTKKGKIQNLLYHLKYKGCYEVGCILGKKMGKELSQYEDWNRVEVIVPVPLHPKKQKKRGYNQSDAIGEGLAETMKIDCMSDAVIRNTHTETQTQMSKEARWDNVAHIFEVKNAEALANKHILLLDDVITTGATLEALSSSLLQLPNVKISVAALACASDL